MCSSGYIPDLNPDLVSLMSHYVQYVLDTVCGSEGSLQGSQICPMAVQTKGWVGGHGLELDVSIIMIEEK